MGDEKSIDDFVGAKAQWMLGRITFPLNIDGQNDVTSSSETQRYLERVDSEGQYQNDDGQVVRIDKVIYKTMNPGAETIVILDREQLFEQNFPLQLEPSAVSHYQNIDRNKKEK